MSEQASNLLGRRFADVYDACMHGLCQGVGMYCMNDYDAERRSWGCVERFSL